MTTSAGSPAVDTRNESNKVFVLNNWNYGRLMLYRAPGSIRAASLKGPQVVRATEKEGIIEKRNYDYCGHSYGFLISLSNFHRWCFVFGSYSVIRLQKRLSRLGQKLAG